MRGRRTRRIVLVKQEQGLRDVMADEIAKRRQAYAAEIARRRGDPRIEAAFAAVPREDFAGPPPWRIGSGGLFGRTAGDDPARLYEDVLVAIDARRGINNGQPSLHAQSIDALAPKEGETVVQIGAGAAITPRSSPIWSGPQAGSSPTRSSRTSPSARAPISPDIPRSRFAPRSGVGERSPRPTRIYVNAAASHPLRAWLDALKVGGRLLFPLQAAHSTGAMLLITRPARATPGRRAFSPASYSSPAKARRIATMAPQARRGVPPRRLGAGGLAAFRREAGPVRLAARRRLGAVDGAPSSACRRSITRSRAATIRSARRNSTIPAAPKGRLSLCSR